MSTKHTLENTNNFFNKFAERKDKTFQAYEYICNTANNALEQRDYSTLLSLITYMENGDGYFAFRYIGDARRLFRILSIISLETKFHSMPFYHNCNALDSLMDKYVLVLFALRRIIFNLSEDSITEALFYLKNQKLSPYAFYILTKDELITTNDLLYSSILQLYDDIWTNTETQQFIALISDSITN